MMFLGFWVALICFGLAAMPKGFGRRYKRQGDSWRDTALIASTALHDAEAFIAEELETRRSSFLPEPTEDEAGYLGTAQAALDGVREAISRMHGDRPSTPEGKSCSRDAK
jgi:hypothetical protein